LTNNNEKEYRRNKLRNKIQNISLDISNHQQKISELQKKKTEAQNKLNTL